MDELLIQSLLMVGTYTVMAVSVFFFVFKVLKPYSHD